MDQNLWSPGISAIQKLPRNSNVQMDFKTTDLRQAGEQNFGEGTPKTDTERLPDHER